MRTRGFTLLELLAAIAVFAVLSALSFRGLSSVLESEARLQVDSRQWGDLSVSFAQLGEDLAMSVERPVRGADARRLPALLLSDDPRTSALTDGAQIVLTRLGPGMGSTAQGVPRRVGYRWRDDKLEYLVWPSPDAAPGTTPEAYTLLERVAGVRWQALDGQGRWLDAWPSAQAQEVLPRAIAVRITLASGEELVRIVALR